MVQPTGGHLMGIGDDCVRMVQSWRCVCAGRLTPCYILTDVNFAEPFAHDKREYFHDGAKIWAIHDEAVRTIRRDMATFVSRIPQQGPRTTKQAGDIMNDLNNKMYRDSLKEKKDGYESETIGVSDGNPPGEGSAAAAATGSAIGAEEGAAGAAQPGEGVVGSAVASLYESPAAAPAEDGGSRPDDSVEAPPEYMHVNLLTFALFGMFSDHPDPDLDVSVSEGPGSARSEGSERSEDSEGSERSEDSEGSEGSEGSDARSPEAAVGSSGGSSPSISALDDSDLAFLIIPASAGKRRRRLRQVEEKKRKLLEEAIGNFYC